MLTHVKVNMFMLTQVEIYVNNMLTHVKVNML